MRPQPRTRSIAIALAATFAIPVGLTVTARAAAPPLGGDLFGPATADSTCYKYAAADRQFTDKMNQERKSRGLGTMRLDPELSWVAKKHTQDMIKANQIFHSSSQQLTSRITRWSTLGENVGVGGDVDSLHQAYMDSPDHRENILFKGFTFVGVGTVVTNGKMWTTTIFELRNNPGTRLRMPC
ncbi:MAG: CAP domain-containing protein [Actinomycetota bacterium]